MEWGEIVSRFRRCLRWTKQRAPLIATSFFFVFVIRTVWIAAVESSQSFLSMQVMSETIFYPSVASNSTKTHDEDEPAIKGTYITGREAVKHFRAYLDCFSESGKWVFDPIPRHLPWNFYGDNYSSACEFRHLLSPDHVEGDRADDIAVRRAPGKWLVREELKWVWQTNSSCPWRSINRDSLCRKIGSKRHVMIVGDSMNQQVSWSLTNALLLNGSGINKSDSKNRSVPGPFELCGDIFGNGKGFRVSFVRNDRLSTINETVPSRYNFYEYPWLHMLEELDIKILLLNRGAHYENDDIYTDALYKIFALLSQRYPHIHVIYRNTQPGHLNCMNFTGPISMPQQEFPPEHHWEDFNRQNTLARKIVEEFDYTYMDVYTMLSLRPDGHVFSRDCLHYCLPGPIDIAAEYFYNILLLL